MCIAPYVGVFVGMSLVHVPAYVQDSCVKCYIKFHVTHTEAE